VGGKGVFGQGVGPSAVAGGVGNVCECGPKIKKAGALPREGRGRIHFERRDLGQCLHLGQLGVERKNVTEFGLGKVNFS